MFSCLPSVLEYNINLPEKGVMYSSHLLKTDFAWKDCNILAPIGAIFQIIFSQVMAITIETATGTPLRHLGSLGLNSFQ